MMNTQTGGINISDYAQKKAAGNVAIGKIGNAYAMTVKRYKVEDGKEDTPQVVAIDIASLEEQKAQLQAAIVDLDTMIADFKALDAK